MRQIVYVIDHWTNSVEKAEVIGKENDVLKIHFLSHIDRNGNETSVSYGDSARKIDDVWDSYEDAYSAIDKQYSEMVSLYIKKIKTVADLLKFPLEHCLCGEEYTILAAIEAYKRRCKELMNIGVE